MTLLSLIAIIASLAAGFGIAINADLYWDYETKDTPVWKRTLWKSLRWFELDEAAQPRRTLLKILFSALTLTALVCGFWDTYSALDAESRGFFAIIGSIMISITSFALLIIICFVPENFKDWISNNYFGVDDYSKIDANKWCIIINSLILCIWVAVFISGLYLENSGRIFALISVSAIVTALICVILFILGAFCYVIGKIIFILIICPLLCWIKWLRK